LEIKIMYFE